jgi:hypothetical protein
MSWASYLPPDRLGAIEWMFVIAAFVFTLLAGACGLAAKKVANYRSDLRNARTEDALAAARRENADLKASAAEDREKIAALEAKDAPRSLSESERAALVKHLSAGKGRSIEFGVPFRDNEARKYSEQIAAAFREAGWTVSGSEQIGRDGRGILILFGAGVNPPPYTTSILQAFREAQITVALHPDPRIEGGELMIFVGQKLPADAIPMGQFPRD